MHCFVSGIGTIGPRKMRHKSSNIVTSIAAPRASIATLGKSHRLPGFSSILQKKLLPECLTLTRKGKHLANSWVSYLTQHFLQTSAKQLNQLKQSQLFRFLPQKHWEAHNEVNGIKQRPNFIHDCTIHKLIIRKLHKKG